MSGFDNNREEKNKKLTGQRKEKTYCLKDTFATVSRPLWRLLQQNYNAKQHTYSVGTGFSKNPSPFQLKMTRGEFVELALTSNIHRVEKSHGLQK